MLKKKNREIGPFNISIFNYISEKHKYGVLLGPQENLFYGKVAT
jgi:hypothetical protein